MKYNRQKGFSLIELFIVIAVIIALATVSVLALNDQRAKTRDSNRISDNRQLRTALEFYYSDEGEYPIAASPIILGSKTAARLCAKTNGGFVASDTPCSEEQIYMTAILPDPLATQSYAYTGEAAGFDIVFVTEKPSTLGPAGIYHAHSQIIDNQAGNK